MRCALAVLALLGWVVPAQAQTPAPGSLVPVPTAAALRTLIETPGLVIVTRQSRLDPIPLSGGGRLVIHAVGAFEPGQEHQRSLGLRLDLESAKLTTEQARHYMDVHEIEALLKGIFLLESVAGEADAKFVSEADYETIEGLVIGVTTHAGRVEYWIEGGRGARARHGLSRARVVTLKQRLELARTRLFSE